MNALFVPIVWGTNRLRGKVQGPMLDDSVGNTTDMVRKFAKAEIQAAGLEPTDALVGNVVQTMLDEYAKGHHDWKASRAESTDIAGHVVELDFPSGAKALMADHRLFARIKLQ